MARQIGIDMGTSNTMIYQKGRGIVLRAPSVIGFDRQTREVIASGVTAKKMLGKTPSGIRALCPIRGGVITTPEITSLMIRDLFETLDMNTMFNRPMALVSVPCGINELEESAVEEAFFRAGAKNVFLRTGILAGALGAGIDVSRARGAMVIDLGGGVSEVAVISLGEIVHSGSIRVAGTDFDASIISYLKQNRSTLIGEISAERLKKKIGCADAELDRGSMKVCGRNLRRGTAVEIEVTTDEVREAIREPLEEILSMVKQTLEETPPELSADVFDSGITLIGGSSLLPGIDRAIAECTGIRVTVAKRPMECVCRGLGKMMEGTGAPASADRSRAK